MAEIITQEDLLIVLQHASNPILKLNIEVLDSEGKIIGNLECGIQSGNMSINGQSDIRRTANFVVQPTLKEKITHWDVMCIPVHLVLMMLLLIILPSTVKIL